MPNINGTNSADDIDVTNDVGTLNGTPQGTPIDRIRARGGDDTVSVTDSTISNGIATNQGNDTVFIQGSNIGNIRLGGGADTLNFIDSSVTNDIQGGGGTDALNLPVGTVANDTIYGPFTITLGGSYNLSSGTFTLPSGQTVTYSQFEDGTGIPCFTLGTMIATHDGAKPIEELEVGDLVITQHDGLQAIRWIGHKQISGARLHAFPHLQPIRIKKDAFCAGQPNKDLVVSPQHRMVIVHALGELLYGNKDFLVPAKSLLDHPSVVIEKVPIITYIHIMFDCHQIIYANGCATESFHPGSYIFDAMDRATQDEIYVIFPEFNGSDITSIYGPTAIPALSVNEGTAFMKQINFVQ